MKTIIALSSTILLLLGCVATKQDGAPSMALAAIHDSYVEKKVEPKYEPKSKYGNPDSYHVLGKTYQVMTSAKDFKQNGLASWYGTKFHQKRTSSGEPYDMFAMTAAHKTLPLPTYVKVRNLENNRETIVKVNDRGPFHEGRIIDLSYAAAKRLGVLKKGTAKVQIETLAPSSSNQTRAARLFLQLAAFNEQAKAIQYKKMLSKLVQSLSALAIEKKNDMYTLVMGPFKNKQQRLIAKQQLLAQGINGAFSFIK